MREVNANTEPLRTLLGDIQRGTLALPDFQRDFVWRPFETKDLLHTVLNRWPAGSILLHQYSEHFFLEPRPFEGAPDVAKRDTKRLVLDGQQRLTALWQALEKPDESCYFLRLRPVLEKKATLEDAIEYLPTKEFAKLFGSPDKQLPDLVMPFEIAMRRFAQWRDGITDVLGDDLKAARTLRDQLQTFDNDLLAALREYTFPVVQLDASTPLSAVCKIFEVTNKRGIKLDAFELMVAKAAATKDNLRQRWLEVLSNWEIAEEANKHEVLEKLAPLQVIALREHKPRGIRQSDVLELDARVVLGHWEDAVAGMIDALEFLRDECGLLSARWLPYPTALIPLAAVFLDIAPLKGPRKAKAIGQLSRWFWATCFGGSYDKGANTQAVKDYDELRAWLLDGKNAPTAVREFAFDSARLLVPRRREPNLFSAAILLGLKNGARDFHSGTRLNAEMVSESKVDAHHLFPAKHLKDSKLEPDQINVIANFTLIDRATNRRIGKSKPSIYLNEMAGELRSSQLASILDSHFLEAEPTSTLWRDEYDGFLEARSRAIADAVKLLVEPENAGTKS
jgi:hypothetical protein